MKAGWNFVTKARGALVLWTFSALFLPVQAEGDREAEDLPHRDDHPSLTLVWNDHYRLFNRQSSRWGYGAMKRELERIFQSIGVNVAVTRESVGRSHEIFVILMPKDGSQWGLPKNAIGTILTEGNRTGPVYIFVPVLMRVVLGRPSDLMRQPIEPQELAKCARALARVVAHEVVHTLIPRMGHDSEGLMEPSLNRDQLSSLEPKIGRAFADRLRTKLAGLTAHP